MTVYVALLRAINVGGTAPLPMALLKSTCEALGFSEVSTYIQSGNVIFRTTLPEAEVAARLNAALAGPLGKAPGVFLRSRAELEAIDDNCPFPAAAPNQVLVAFLGQVAPEDALHGLVAGDGEEVVAIGREIFVHYPLGAGRSKLKLPILKTGTARNMNTVRKLAGLAARLEDDANGGASSEDSGSV